MKKKLEADLISIAHRVLQMKNKSDVNQLYAETQKLYEKLSVLKFVEDNFSDLKPTIGQAEIIAKIDQITQSELPIKEVQDEIPVAETVVEEVVEDEIIEAVVSDQIPEPEKEAVTAEVKEIEETKKDLDFLPAFDLDVEEETSKKADVVQISFEDLLGANYDEPLFVKVDHSKEKANPLDFELPKVSTIQKERAELLAEIQVSPKDMESKTATAIDKPITAINIGLNDRIAFVKHLFGNSNEDYNRVLNQLITFDSFVEAQNFIEDMVKPDYNNWEGKEEYSERFIQIIEKKFA